MSWWKCKTIVVTSLILSGYIVGFAYSTQHTWLGMSGEIMLDRLAQNCMGRESNTGEQYTCQDWSHHNFTVVTALFDIGRDNWPYYQRSYQDYLSYGQQLLSMDINLVVFIEPKGKPFVEEHRRGKESKTVIHVMDKKELLNAKLYLKKAEGIMESPEFKANHQLLKHPEGFCPWYNIVTNSKVNMVYNAILLDTFNSSFYSWVDFGYAHGNEVYPASRVWAPRNIMTRPTAEKITHIQLHDQTPQHITDVFKKRGRPFLSGGFFAGSKKAMIRYNDLFNKVFKQCIDEGIIDDDQSLSLACYHEEPSLFNLVRGDWYDLFKLFH